MTGSNGGDSTAPTPVITILGASGPQPHTVFVHAIDSILGAGTVLTARYQWNFGDPGSEYNSLTTWEAAHTYNNPGTYTITLTLTNQLGKTRVLSTKVTVATPTYHTIYVDSVNGNDKNNGSVSSQAIQSFTKATAIVNNNTQILFRAGETFNVYNGMSLPFSNVLIGSYGSGAQPVLMRQTGNGVSILSMFGNSSNIMVQDVTFNSPWSSTSVTAPKIAAEGIFPAGTDITIRRCTFLNLDNAVDEDRNPQGTLIQDCTAPLTTGLRGCFLWAQGTDQVVLGNYVANSTQEHNIRTVQTVREFVAYNNLTNLYRSTSTKGITTSKGTIDIHRGTYAYVADNWTYDGELRIGPRIGPALSPGDITQWCVVEGNHTFAHAFQIYPGTYDLMVRNNIFSMNTDVADIDINPHNAAGDNIKDITFANNTGVTIGTAGEFMYIDSGGAAGQLTLENNLWIAPSVIPGQGGTSGIHEVASTPAIFADSSYNVFTMPKTFNAYAAGGINYINTSWLPPKGYYTPKAWNALSFVTDDQFSQTAVSADDTPLLGTVAATASRAVYGVFTDMNGKLRPNNGIWTAGALQT